MSGTPTASGVKPEINFFPLEIVQSVLNISQRVMVQVGKDLPGDASKNTEALLDLHAACGGGKPGPEATLYNCMVSRRAR